MLRKHIESHYERGASENPFAARGTVLESDCDTTRLVPHELSTRRRLHIWVLGLSLGLARALAEMRLMARSGAPVIRGGRTTIPFTETDGNGLNRMSQANRR
jgi:hypothetical protein